MSTANKLLQAASGGSKDLAYVEDVFSTDLWAGDGSSETITNGIDFSGEGGMVWFARRTTTDLHAIIDTERGGNKAVLSTANSANYTNAQMITSFNSNGFTVGSYAGVNENNEDLVGWSFRKKPGFFDVQTWTGNGSAADIAHDLGCVPAFVMYKRTDTADDWKCYHVGTDSSSPQSYFLELNSSNARQGASGEFSAAPTATHLKLNSGLHGAAQSYVAYIFAGTGDSDSQIFGDDSDEAIIKCGSYTTNSSGNATVDLGFEPQWVLDKTSNYSANWSIVDFMRGFDTRQSNGYDQAAILYANANNAESLSGGKARITSTGFTVTGTTASQTFIYVAIRRPMKAPEYGTDVFATSAGSSSGALTITSNFRVDFNFIKNRTGSSDWYFSTRNTGSRALYSNSTQAEIDLGINWDRMTGWQHTGTGDYSAWSGWNFKRAAKFLDILTYIGNATNGRTITHNLGVAPEIIITKRRSSSDSWVVGANFTGSNYDYLNLNGTSAANNNSYAFRYKSQPNATSYTIDQDSSINGNNETYIAWLFATLDGISKVGTYSGTGSDVNVDCGFSSGARFVLIKRTDDTGPWIVFDSVRGIVSGNDPYILLNSTDAQVTGNDLIDPLSSGFTVVAGAGSSLNASGGTYIFVAIA